MRSRAKTEPARESAFTPGSQWRGLRALVSQDMWPFVLVARTPVPPLARVLVPDHPPLRFGWSGTGGTSCVTSDEVPHV